MKNIISVKLPENKSYDIVIGSDILKDIEKYIKHICPTKHVALITDTNVEKIYSKKIEILLNESNIIHIGKIKLLISGIPDRSAGHYVKSHRTNMKKTLGENTNINFKILLAHQPKDIEHAIKYKYDLQLSGHTHGGQYYPFSFLVQLVHPFLKGLHKKGNTQIYINQGTGYWGPSIRIGTVPEITEIVLTKA